MPMNEFTKRQGDRHEYDNIVTHGIYRIRHGFRKEWLPVFCVSIAVTITTIPRIKNAPEDVPRRTSEYEL